MEAGQPKSGKKIYSKPELVIYGDVRDITRTIGNKSAVDDGGMGSTDKTA